MWGRLYCVFALWNTISTQPIADAPEHAAARPARQLGECCPCPSAREGLAAAATAARLDDCPCWPRDADSAGAASGLLQRAVRPAWDVVKPTHSKDDAKPLLHPEVDLASNVLQTLREATDEEYRDALARDAARSAAKAADPDTEAENIVAIILNPKPEEDAVIQEASHVQEVRCTHPLGPHELGQVRSEHSPLGDIRLSKVQPKGLLHRHLDMDSGASNVQEHVDTSLNKGLDGLKFRSNPSLFNLLPGKANSVENGNQHGIFKLRNNVNKVFKSASNSGNDLDEDQTSSKFPNLKLSPVLNKFNIKTSKAVESLRSNNINRHLIPKLKLNKAEQSEVDEFDNSPSNNNEIAFIDSEAPRFGLKTLMKTDELKKRPIRFKNFLNLKDVELIPPKSNKAKIDIDKIKLTPAKQRNNENTALKNNNNSDYKPKSNLETNTHRISVEEGIKTEIIDVEPSATENRQTITEHENTEILDAVPSAAEHHEDVQDIGTETGVSDLLDNDPIDSDSTDSDITSKDGPINENINLLPKQGVEFFDPNNINGESIIIEDGNSDIIIIVENGEPNQFQNFNDDNEVINADFLEQPDNDQDSDDIVLVEPEEDIEINDFDPLFPQSDSLSDSETNASDNVFHIIRVDDIENDYDDIQLDNQFRTEATRLVDNSDSLNQELTQYPTVKDSSFENIEDTPNEQAETTELLEREENDDSSTVNESNDNGNSNEDTITQSFNEPTSTKDDSEEITKTENPIKIEDLQNLSDSLLDLSKKKEQSCDPEFKTFDGKPVEEHNMDSSATTSIERENNESSNESNNELTERSDLEQSASSSNSDVRESVNDPIASFEDLQDNDKVNRSDENEQEIVKNDNVKSSTDSECLVRLETKSAPANIAKTSESNIEPNEMTAEASEPIFNIVPQDAIVQPASIFGDDFFRRPILNLNTQLPSIDDIRSGLSNILSENERAANRDESVSSEFEDPSMSAAASTTNTKSLLPSRNPLENINLDIFQLNPLTKARTTGLNLNSYKTRMPLPKDLGLKPVQLQSSLGKDGGLLGATLTFGPDKIGPSRKVKPSVNRKATNVFRKPFVTPDVDDLRDRMRNHAENLLNSSPLRKASTPLHAGPTISTLSDNLRSHTANAMKNIQQTLASTRNEAKVKDFNLLGNQYAKPQHVFEDMNDKLQALHMDFNDRLSSIHDRIVDKSRWPALRSPAIKTIGNSNSRPTLFQVSQPKSASIPRLRPTSLNNGRLGASQGKTVIDQNKIRPYKMSKAASSLAPKSVEVPKLTATSVKPPFSIPLHRNENVQLKENKPVVTEPIRTQGVRPVLRNKLKPFGESKVKVSISSTARPTLSTSRLRPETITTKPKFSPKTTNERLTTTLNPPRNRPTTLLQRRPISDSKGHASELKSLRVPANVQSTIRPPLDPENIKSRASQMRQNPVKSPGSKPKPPLLNQSSASANQPQPGTSSLIVKPKAPTVADGTVATPEQPRNTVQPISWPKITDDSFMTRVREALQSRLVNLTPKAPKIEDKMRSSYKSDDMDRSASENKEVVLANGEPLKENVSYRCRMVCIKEPIE